MNRKQRGYIIAGSIMAVALAFTIFAGFTNVKFTQNAVKRQPDAAADQTENEVPSSENPEAAAPETDALPEEESVMPSEEPETPETEPTIDIYAELEDITNEAGEIIAEGDAIHALTNDEIAGIRSSYAGDEFNYIPTDEVDDLNRPVTAVNMKTHFDDVFGAGVVKLLEEDTAEVHLMFVLAGANADLTNQVLDVLGEKKVKALFFTDHAFAAENRMIIQRIITEGHEIGSVGASYPAEGLGACALEDQVSDIWNLHELMHNDFSYTMTKFYYGNGVISDQDIALVSRMGYTPVIYSVNYPADADGSAALDLEAYLWDLESKVHYGANYLFYLRNTATPSAVATLTNFLTNSGYSITKIK